MESDLLYKIRSDLVTGKFRQGEWLRLQELEQRYGASRFEVRKALAALAALKALEHVENHGYRVLTFDPQRDIHHMEVRLTLELSAAPAVMQAVTRNDLKNLSGLARRFEWLIENGSQGEIEQCNHEFHRTFFASCRNTVLTDLIHNMRELFMPHTKDPYATLADRRRSARQHFRMVECLEKQDLPGLLEVIRQHLSRPPLAVPGEAEAAGGSDARISGESR